MTRLLLFSLFYVAFSAASGLLQNYWGDQLFEIVVPTICEGISPESSLEQRESCGFRLKLNQLLLNATIALLMSALLVSVSLNFFEAVVVTLSPSRILVPSFLLFLFVVGSSMLTAESQLFLAAVGDVIGSEKVAWALLQSYLWQLVPLCALFAYSYRMSKRIRRTEVSSAT